MQFPIFKTKNSKVKATFDLNNPKEREKYFQLKVGKEIKKLREYFRKGNTFVAYLVGKKNSGKGTYSKMFAEIVDPERIEHFSIGDMIRGVDNELKDPKKKKELFSFLEKNYRGWQSAKDLMSFLEKRSTKTLLPTELILALVKREIGKRQKKTIFLDGFPRDLDQINFTLFFRDLIGYREDPDFFVLIDVPEKVIDERIKYRMVCPHCQTSRNFKLLPTSKIGYEAKKKEFYLLCDNPKCRGARMVRKEGDDFGIKPIKDRLKRDGKLINQAFSLYGIPKILLRNSVPKKSAKSSVDDYEITPEYYYEWKGDKAIVKERPWLVPDDNKEPSYSLLPPPVVVSLIKQISDVLGL
ncbi:MAG TPA: nucleoside monophosphate kinase [Candidatus Paceibacterota bacterium]|nr:nucleoside monophosphate kinase [Candidatus Paceibacterota bacterium]